MNKTLLCIIVMIFQFQFGFSQLNMSLLGHLPYSGKGDNNDIWGYVDEFGNEYALVGLEAGVSVVDVTNPSSPNEVFWADGVYSIWRDIKTWNDKAYVTTEGGSGLMIIDLSPLPGNTTLPVSYYTGNNYPFATAHNLYIDENGYCYIFGSNNGNGGAIILNLNLSPADSSFEVGRYNDYYLHDGVVRGDTLWGAAINDGFFVVVEVSNKLNPFTIASQNTPSFGTHNCWISNDGQTLFTTDEKTNAYIASYDVSDMGNISELDRVQSNPGMNVVPHNTHFINNYLVTSYYRDGVVIHDVSNPSSMIEVGNYDTSPAYSGDGFNGCWGVYPWLPSGNIIASDIENGLYILGVNYTRACHVKGNVTNLNTLAPLDAVQIQLLTTGISTNSNIVGDYITGVAAAGSYDLVFSKQGFFNDTIYNVSLSSGNTTVVDAQLEPFPRYTFSGQVLELGTMNPISNAQVHLKDSIYDLVLTTNALGNFVTNNLMLGTYEVTVGKWGEKTICFSYLAEQDTSNFAILLDKGYYDDFSLDFNWAVTGDANSGIWEKGEPVGLTIGSYNITPDADVNSDCGVEAFVTGNSGQSGGQDDVAGGTTVLTSPVFDATLYANPYVQYTYWFYTGFGSIQDDKMIFKLNNGLSEVIIDQADVNSPGMSTWVNKTFQISNFITPTNSMQFIVEIGDLGNQNVVEGGFDQFEIRDIPLGVKQMDEETNIKIYPNPFNEILNIEFDLEEVKVDIMDVTGRVINTYNTKNKQKIQLNNQYNKGIYFVNVYSNGNLVKSQKMVRY
ncbi:MAG: choice-of-anchor B family protein [Flavobacteriales bacterium]|nr:choice-of-anchor B family protein [Flavobacteriales bacterium]